MILPLGGWTAVIWSADDPGRAQIDWRKPVPADGKFGASSKHSSQRAGVGFVCRVWRPGFSFEAAGFETVGFEVDADCCATYNANLKGRCNELFLSKKTQYPAAYIVIGGPPCQPFSVGGHQLGLEDARDGFPAFVAAVEQLQPKLWMELIVLSRSGKFRQSYDGIAEENI